MVESGFDSQALLQKLQKLGEKVRRRLESHFGRMIRPGTVGTYPQLTPHYLTYCRNLCILST